MKITILLTVLVLSGCSAFTSKDCGTRDWYKLGYNDGLEGLPKQHFVMRSNNCSGDADKAAYSEGRKFGVNELCTKKGSFKFALKGGSQFFVRKECSNSSNIMKHFRVGHDIYLLKMDIKDRNDTIEDLVTSYKFGDKTEEEKEQILGDIDSLKNQQKADMKLIEVKTKDAKEYY